MSTAYATQVITRRPARPAVRQVPAPGSSLRLTRRGRLVVLLTGLLAVLALGVWLAAGSVATSEPEQTRVITVADGDTLWSLASELAEDGGTASVVSHIREINHLETSDLSAGQQLRLPLE